MHSIPIMAAQQIVQRTTSALERLVDEALAARPAAVDLVVSEVQLLDSTGLNWLLGQQARLETLGAKLRLVAPSPIFRDILTATRLETRFEVQAAADEAAGPPGGDAHAR